MTPSAQSPTTMPVPAEIGGLVEAFPWQWQGQQTNVIYETVGQGAPVLLLPAFSTVSSRGELRAIAQSLASEHHVTALDWLGFGQSDRPSLNYQTAIYHQLLQDFVPAVFEQPVTVIAAGHAAGYALQLARVQPNAVEKLILIAPTWKGPLRTMGIPKPLRDALRQFVRSPVLGQSLYYLNTTPAFLRSMYASHVYTDQTKLTTDLMANKWQLTQQAGARYAPAAFVTGAIDPVSDRADFLDYLKTAPVPVLVIVAEQAPPSSKAEMEAMAALPKVQAVRLPGALGLYEEYPQAVIQAIHQFFGRFNKV